MVLFKIEPRLSFIFPNVAVTLHSALICGQKLKNQIFSRGIFIIQYLHLDVQESSLSMIAT